MFLLCKISDKTENANHIIFQTKHLQKCLFVAQI